MPSRTEPESEPLLSVPGVAADHLYREGSAKASFWETLFGSSLSTKRRTRVSALADGTREFDVPMLAVEREIRSRLRSWLETSGATLPGSGGSVGENLRVALIGRQAMGQSVASFALRFDLPDAGPNDRPPAAETLRRWFAAEGAVLAKDVLIPFGFTPLESRAPSPVPS